MVKANRSRLIARLARLECACAPVAKRPTGVVRVSLKDGQALPEDMAINKGAAVMIAPEAASLEEWESIAMASQRRLKTEVRK